MNRIDMLSEIAGIIGTGGVVAEVGVLRGRYTAAIQRVLSPAKLYLVDPWQASFGGYDDYPELTQAHWESLCERVSKRYPDARILRMTSAEAARQVPDGSLDMVYIDADHSKAAEDLALWIPKVRVGGVVAGHDYDYKGVANAVAVHCPSPSPVLTDDKSCLSYYWVR
jgi:hypothetical protein